MPVVGYLEICNAIQQTGAKYSTIPKITKIFIWLGH